MSVFQAVRTGIVVSLVVLSLCSCSLGVQLAIANETGSPVFVGYALTLTRIDPGQRIILRDWPKDNLLTVKTNGCIRLFDLTENYSPANEWRSAGSKNVRRFDVHGDGMLRIKIPDRNHTLSPGTAPLPPRLEMTAQHQSCSS